MAPSIPALAERSVLRWARESIGLSEVAAARKMNLPEDRVAKWESGEEQPTIAQLRKAATAYNRSLAVFFLPKPPVEFDTLRDFRRHAGADDGAWSPELHVEFRRAHRQRDNALELFELDEDEPSAEWRLSIAGSDEEIAAGARLALLAQRGVELEDVATAHGHLNFWTTALERTGVLVMSTARGKVATAEMRAFSLYFDVLPVIMVNGADSARGRLFSLLHEYAHLLLRTNGLCDTATDFGATSPDRRIEARCNAIAAAILMPASEVLRRPEVQARINQPETWTYDALRAAAAPFSASAEAFLRRLVTLGRVSTTFYQTRRAEFLHAYEDDEARTRKAGGDWYRNTARDLGKGYVRQVADAHRRRVIDSYTAADYLNVKVSQIDRLAEMATASKAG